MELDQLREKALVNFEILLNYWNLDYKKITNEEYDIIATWRTDKNFGSVRFNTEKGRGADFAGGSIVEEDYSRLGAGFSREDFAGFSFQGQAKIGFDVVGLCQRVHAENSYNKATELLNRDIEEVSKQRFLYTPGADAYIRRQKEQENKTKKRKQYAIDLWESSKYHKFEGSAGERYLKCTRNIENYVTEENIRFHPSIHYTPTKTNYPALLFKVQERPDGPLVGIHRIYLDQDGTKAKLDNPKMALAPIKGSAIWFGEPSTLMCLAEGPENALTLRAWGYQFVASSIFGTNLHNLTIPKCVQELLIFPDPDEPGLNALERARETYGKLKIKVEGIIEHPSLDINDLMGRHNG